VQSRYKAALLLQLNYKIGMSRTLLPRHQQLRWQMTATTVMA
jgi:hypothetical protein